MTDTHQDCQPALPESAPHCAKCAHDTFLSNLAGSVLWALLLDRGTPEQTEFWRKRA